MSDLILPMKSYSFNAAARDTGTWYPPQEERRAESIAAEKRRERMLAARARVAKRGQP